MFTSCDKFLEFELWFITQKSGSHRVLICAHACDFQCITVKERERKLMACVRKE